MNVCLGRSFFSWEEARTGGKPYLWSHRRDSRSLGSKGATRSSSQPRPPAGMNLYHLRCGWLNGSVPGARGRRAGRGEEGAGRPFCPLSRLERDPRASPRGRRPRGCLLSPASPSRLLPARPFSLPSLCFLLSLPVSLRVCYPSLSFSVLSLCLSPCLSTHTSPTDPEGCWSPSPLSHSHQRAEDPRLEHRVLAGSQPALPSNWTSIRIPVALPTSVRLIFSCN